MDVPARKKPLVKVGDRVRFRLATRMVSGDVIESFGNIGIRGEQLVRVEVPMDRATKVVFELGADALAPSPRPRSRINGRSRRRRATA